MFLPGHVPFKAQAEVPAPPPASAVPSPPSLGEDGRGVLPAPAMGLHGAACWGGRGGVPLCGATPCSVVILHALVGQGKGFAMSCFNAATSFSSCLKETNRSFEAFETTSKDGDFQRSSGELGAHVPSMVNRRRVLNSWRSFEKLDPMCMSLLGRK